MKFRLVEVGFCFSVFLAAYLNCLNLKPKELTKKRKIKHKITLENICIINMEKDKKDIYRKHPTEVIKTCNFTTITTLCIINRMIYTTCVIHYPLTYMT